MSRSPAIRPMMSVNEATALKLLFEASRNPKLRARVLELVPDLIDMIPAYTIDGDSITCGRCGLTSHNRNDIEKRYCGNCHIFHDHDGSL